MPLPVNSPQHFVKLLLMPDAAFNQYYAAVSNIDQLRKGMGQPVPVEAVVIKDEPTLQTATQPVPSASPRMEERPSLPQRPPMREPKPDSLRAVVHEVLRGSGKPLQRREIAARVAAARGVPVSPALVNAVGNALTNRHDPLIRKHGAGVYAITPNTLEETVCL